MPQKVLKKSSKKIRQGMGTDFLQESRLHPRISAASLESDTSFASDSFLN
jgi:hypothetical protein